MSKRRENQGRRRGRRYGKGGKPRILDLQGPISGNIQPVVFTRTYMRPIAFKVDLDDDSVLYPNQGTSGQDTITVALTDFITEAGGRMWDSYRFNWISITAKYNPYDKVTPPGLSNMVQPIDIFTSFDPTGLSPPSSWERFANRANIGRTTVTPTRNAVKLITVKPAVVRSSDAGDTGNSVVFDSDMFYNTIGGTSTLRFGKIDIYCHCNTFNSSSGTPFVVDFECTASISLKGCRGQPT